MAHLHNHMTASNHPKFNITLPNNRAKVVDIR
jgi:hypothetical protein